MNKTRERQMIQNAIQAGGSVSKAGSHQPSLEQAAHPVSAEKSALIAKAASALVEKAMRLAAKRDYSPTIYQHIHTLQVRYGEELKRLAVKVDGQDMNAYSALTLAKATYAATLEPPGGCGSARSRMNSIPPMTSPILAASEDRPGAAEMPVKSLQLKELKAAIDSLIKKTLEASVYDQGLAIGIQSICASEKDRLPSISVTVDGRSMSADAALIQCQKRVESLPPSQGPW